MPELKVPGAAALGQHPDRPPDQSPGHNDKSERQGCPRCVIRIAAKRDSTRCPHRFPLPDADPRCVPRAYRISLGLHNGYTTNLAGNSCGDPCEPRKPADSVRRGEFGQVEQDAVVRSPHNPGIIQRADGPWIVECRECRDGESSVPIGIGMPLLDRVTAQRLAENHAGPGFGVRTTSEAPSPTRAEDAASTVKAPVVAPTAFAAPWIRKLVR